MPFRRLGERWPELGQRRLGAGEIGGGVADPAAALKAAVLATSPIAYHPCDDASGASTLADATGNNRPLDVHTPAQVTFEQNGKVGKCLKIDNATATYTIDWSSALVSAFVPANSSIMWLLKCVNGTKNKVGGLANAAGTYYFAYELRSLVIAHFQSENTVLQTLNTKFGNAPANEWFLLIAVNDETNGNLGYYINRDYIPDVRASNLPGFSVSVDGNSGLISEFDGGSVYLQHVAEWNKVITQSEVNGFCDLIFGTEEYTLAYDMRDDFTTNDDAPITSPRTAEPGPGTGTAVDTGNNFSIASGQLTFSTRVGDNDPRLFYGSVAKPNLNSPSALVKGFVGKVTPGRLRMGFGDVTTARPAEAAINVFSTTLGVHPNGASLTLATVTGVEHQVAGFLRRFGVYFLVKGGAYSEWTLVYVDNQDLATTLYPGISENVTGSATLANTLRVCNLPVTNFSSFALVDTRVAGKVSASQTFTHTADCGIELTIDEMVTGVNIIELVFRKQDATNYWSIQINASGDCNLIETVAGSPTTRGTSSGLLAADSRVFLQLFGTTIRGIRQNGLNNSVMWTYTSAANFATETDGELLNVGDGQVCDLIVWPRTLAAADAAYLDAALA